MAETFLKTEDPEEERAYQHKGRESGLYWLLR
jgi:hypothetical protein